MSPHSLESLKPTTNSPHEFLITDNQERLDINRPHLKRKSRSKTRELFCPAHPEQRISGNGRKYFLHLVDSEALRQRGMSDKRAKLVIQAYPVLVLSNEWLEELFCPQCGSSHWCHVVRHDRVVHTVRWAPRELWEQVAHVDPCVPNPSVSEFSRRSARRANALRSDGKRYYDA